MTITEALKLYKDVEAGLLLGHFMNKPQEFLFLHSEKKLTPVQEKKLKALAQRRLKGEPYAYLVGYKYFYGLKFEVNKNVLIPRPETEWLVEQALQIVGKKSFNILDLGTGSGCIAISVAKNLPRNSKTKIVASDVSAAALKVAQKNAQLHKAQIKFYQSDLLENVPGQFDLIIANLPYVPVSDYKKLKANLKYEPKLALTYNTGKGVIYEKLFRQLSTKLKNHGKVLLEIDPSNKPLLKKLSKNLSPEFSISFTKDLNNLWRYAVLAKNNFS